MVYRLLLVVVAITLAFSSKLALESNAQQPTPAPPSVLKAVHTGVDGIFPCGGDGFIAFAVAERLIRTDLNSDGDDRDVILFYYDLVLGAALNTGIITGFPVRAAHSIAIASTDEGSAGLDLNGDGDAWDDVVRYYDIDKRELVNVGVDAWSDPSSDGRVIAFSVLEARLGQDLNGDDDKEDIVVMYFDLATRKLVNTKAIGDRPSVGSGIIAMQTSERDVGLDLNGDGDARDVVIRYYDLKTGQVINIGALGRRPAVGNGFIAYQVDEFEADKDLNGDGDDFDDVVHLYDLRSKRVLNLGVETSRRSLAADGAFILFEQFELLVDKDLNGDNDKEDDILFYYDVATGEVVNTQVAALFPCTDGWTAYFSTFEADMGTDLNRDGDQDDFIVSYLDLPGRIVLKEGWNLVALPRVLPPENVVSLLSSIGGKYRVAAVFDPARSGQPWRILAPEQRVNDITALDRTIGLWLDMKEPAILAIPGGPPSITEIKLRQGWNLVGFPARTGRPIRTALLSIQGKYDAVYSFVQGGSSLWEAFFPDQPAALSTLTRLAPGRGYWVHMKEAATLWVQF